MKKNKKILLTAATIATLSLTACNGYTDRTSYNDNHRTDYMDGGYSYANRSRINDSNFRTDADTGYNDNGRLTTNQSTDRVATDTHLDFVSNYGFENVANLNGTAYHQRYRLDSNNATNDDVFHSWRHAWVEPSDYMDKDIDLYQYTGNMNGKTRTIHIMSHNGKPIGGYHFGYGETAEQGVMLERDGFTSRAINDFRGTWNNMFDIRG